MLKIILLLGLNTVVLGDYWNDRQNIIKKEETLSLSGSLKLTAVEERANRVLMKYKETEWSKGFKQPGSYPANLHFFHAKPLIEQSKVFNIIRHLPKGALLHTHDTGMVSFEYLYNLTYTPHLYICMDDEKFELKFFKVPDDSECPYGTWELLQEKRKETPRLEDVLKETLSLVCDNPHETYKDINQVWSKFQGIFMKVAPLITYKPIFEQYHYQALQELYDDNVKYVELRTTLPDLYDIQGKLYKNKDVISVYKEVTERFKIAHPDFQGCKIIYAPPRHVTNETMGHYIDILKDIKSSYNDFVLGFDLVGQEDLGGPLSGFLDYLLPLKDKMQFYFHSGETDWYGCSTDENLIDAVLLGTKRIGHGYALLKHPEVLKLVKERSIAIEVSPISNLVLKLVDDIRNHPASIFGAFGLPMVITNDDPSYWGAKGLSYDWYMAFMGIASRRDDLRYLKQLAINSIEYSGLAWDDKKQMFLTWNADWDKFIQNLVSDKLIDNN